MVGAQAIDEDRRRDRRTGRGQVYAIALPSADGPAPEPHVLTEATTGGENRHEVDHPRPASHARTGWSDRGVDGAVHADLLVDQLACSCSSKRLAASSPSLCQGVELGAFQPAVGEAQVGVIADADD